MNCSSRLVLILSMAVVLLAINIFANVPQIIDFQGRLTDDAGDPVTGTVSIEFTIYDDSTGGNPKWTEVNPSVDVVDGLFAVKLGSINPIVDTVFKNPNRYLAIKVGADPEIEQRHQLSSTGYAFQAVQADTAYYSHNVAPNSVSSPYIADGSIQFDDMAQNGATEGQVMKWVSGDWTAANDETGGSGGGGWVDDGIVVRLETSTDYVGIGNSTPSENLVIGTDLGGYPGNRIAVGDNTPGTWSGLILGKDTDNRGWFLWDVDSSYMNFGTKESGVGYAGTMHIRSGNVGINTNNPSQKLDVNGGIKISSNIAADASENCGFWDYYSGNIRFYSQGDLSTRGGFYFNIRKSDGSETARAIEIQEDADIILAQDDGNVGVGTDNPQFNFHITGEFGIDGNIGLGNQNGNIAVSGANGENFHFHLPDATTPKYFFNDNDNNKLMTILNDGSVGIGTTNPIRPLHISSSDAMSIILEIPTNPVDERRRSISVMGDNSLVFGKFDDAGGLSDEHVRINSDGYVGVGTSDPEVSLQVSDANARIGLSELGVSVDNGKWDIQANGEELNFRAMNDDYNAQTTWLNVQRTGTTIDEVNVPYGNVGIGTTTPSEKLDVIGTTRTTILEITGGSDLAEKFEINSNIQIKPGMLACIDPDNHGQLIVSKKAYDKTIAGVISGANGLNPGLIMKQEGSNADGAFPIALTGRVYCWADASGGPIKPGDLLTTSNTPGHAMKVTDYSIANGAILGKAMSRLDDGTGLILVLVSLQ